MTSENQSGSDSAHLEQQWQKDREVRSWLSEYLPATDLSILMVPKAQREVLTNYMRTNADVILASTISTHYRGKAPLIGIVRLEDRVSDSIRFDLYVKPERKELYSFFPAEGTASAFGYETGQEGNLHGEVLGRLLEARSQKDCLVELAQSNPHIWKGTPHVQGDYLIITP